MHISFRLKTKRGSQKGNIQGVISHGNPAKYFSTGITHLPKSYWSAEKQEILPKADNDFYPGFHAQMNLMLINFAQNIRKRYFELLAAQHNPKDITAEFIYNTSIGKESRAGATPVLKPASLLEGIEAFIEYKKVEITASSLRTLKSNLSSIEKMQIAKGKTYKFKDLSLNFMHELKTFLLEEKKKPGSISNVGSSLKQAIDFFNRKGWCKVEDHGKFKITVPRITKPALSLEELSIFENAPANTPNEQFAKYLFIMRCHLGFRHSDTEKAFKGIREENGQYVLDIITKKKQTRARITLNDTAFPIYLRLKDQWEHMSLDLVTHNRILKDLAKRVGLTRKVKVLDEAGLDITEAPLFNEFSTHMAPRTCITNLLASGVPVQDVALMVGKDIKTITNNYYNPHQ